MPADLQTRSAGAGRNANFGRSGAHATLKANFRLIAATNRQLRRRSPRNRYVRICITALTLSKLKFRRTRTEAGHPPFGDLLCETIRAAAWQI